jgi:Uncharacterized conserved protein
MLIEIIKILVATFVGTLSFCVMFHSPKKAIVPAALIGTLTYILYFVANQLGLSVTLSTLVASAIGSVVAQLASRRMKIIATVFIIAAMIPLVPGLGLYQSMAMLASGDAAAAMQLGISTMKIVLMLALGMSVGAFVFGAAQKQA